MKYLFSGQPELRQACGQLLRVQPEHITAEQLLADMVQQVSCMATRDCTAGWTSVLRGSQDRLVQAAECK